MHAPCFASNTAIAFMMPHPYLAALLIELNVLSRASPLCVSSLATSPVPSGLVIRADAGAGVTVEITRGRESGSFQCGSFWKISQIPSHGTATVFTAQKDSVQATRDLSRDFG